MKKTFFYLCTLLILVSCSELADFSEYSGINYLNSLSFDAGTEINWIRDDNSGTYMNFTTVVPPTTNGLPASVTDYSRLEIVNLMSDGDFEGGAGGWTAFNGGSIIIQPGDGFTINPANQSLRFSLNSTQRIDYDLESLPGIVDNGEYLIRLNFNRNIIGNAVFEHNNNGAVSYDYWKPSITADWSGNNYVNYPALITIRPGANNDYFSIGSTTYGISQIGNIDDVQVIRSDISLKLRADVPYTAAGRPDFTSGNYSFSIYVLKDNGPVSPDLITLSINNYSDTIDVSALTNTEWVKVSIDKFVHIFENDSIELSISPSDISSPYLKSSGSILISCPILEYN